VPRRLPRLVACVAIACACGCTCGKKSPGGAKDDASLLPRVAPIALPPLGVDRIARMNFLYGDGAAAYDKALAKKKSRDWAAVRAECEAAVARDATHFDAQWLLGTALAQSGEPAAAVDHFSAALAGDYYKYGAALGADADLVDFMATSHGKSVAALALAIRGEYVRRAQTAAWLVGRRSTFKWPKDFGVQPDTTRGELYAFDREAKRYLRLTHTDHQVAGFVRAASGSEVALIGFDKIDRAKDDAPPLVARAWVEAVDTTEWKPLGPRSKIDAAREIAVGYGAGDQLVVTTAPASGRWGAGAKSAWTVDRSSGKLTKIDASSVVPRVELTLDEGRLVHTATGVQTTLAAEGVVSSIKTDSGVAIPIPESGQAADATIAVAPGGARVAFATAVDPCDDKKVPSLYVGDAKTGTIKHVLTARSRFATRWIDAATLAYEDGEGAIRLWDATTQREAQKLDNKAGIALDVLSLASSALCKQAPPTIEPAGSDEMPKEEPAATPN
jgi:hypothetical protein